MAKKTTEVLDNEPAVYLRDACLSFDPSDPVVVLDHLNLTVPRGQIYGLLGASGCGKSSLLSCIVGIRKLDKGHIKVLGENPGSPGSGIPGPKIGYMPQEIALMSKLTISSIMFYFGRIFGMSNAAIQERLKYLCILLDLPALDECIKHLSTGQQLRVSLAVALLHDPDLLILDEPTVGLDSVLRQRIWDYMKEITEEGNKSVIITTHYIEEARQANIIGMMRQGKILAENCPTRMMEQFKCTTLELVFLKLSLLQSLDEPTVSTHDSVPLELTHKKETKKPKIKCSKISHRPSNYKIMEALLKKDFLEYYKNLMLLAYLFIFPVVHFSLFYIAIGHNPKHTLLAVVNDEQPGTVPAKWNTASQCNISTLSCRYLSTINKKIINLKPYPDLDSAVAAVVSGHVLGALHFSSNFSEAITDKYLKGLDASNVTLKNSEIEVWMDNSQFSTSQIINDVLHDAYVKFSKKLKKDCKKCQNTKNVLQFQKPIYGSVHSRYIIFLLPGIFITILHFFGVATTCSSIVIEILEGIWQRDLISGVQPAQMVIAHLVTQTTILLVQTAEIIAFAFFTIEFENKGSTFLLYFVTVLQGICGISLGIFISFVSSSMTMASSFALLSFFVVMIPCGMFWPIEGMPFLMRIICQQLPPVSGMICIRSIICKGWGICHPVVYECIARAVLWSISFIVASLIVIPLKK